MTGITQSEFARQTGVSKQYINKLVKQGKLPVLDSGRIDPDVARVALDKIRDPARRLGKDAPDGAGESRNAPRSHTAVDPASDLFDVAADDYNEDGDAAATHRGNTSFNHVAIAHKGWQAKRAELEYKQAAGLLIDKGDVEREAFDVARAVRDRMIAIPAEVAGVLVGMANEQEIASFLRAKIRDALMETSAYVGVGA